MAEPKAGLSPVHAKHGSTQGLGGSVSSRDILLNLKVNHSRAGQKHQPINGERLNTTLNATSRTMGAGDGAACSTSGRSVVSKDGGKKLKGKEAQQSLHKKADNLTRDSPKNDETRLRDNASSGLSFLGRHHRIGCIHRSFSRSNEGSSHQVPVETDIPVLSSRRTVESGRSSSWRVPSSPGVVCVEKVSDQRTLEKQNKTGYLARDALTSSSGASSRERRDMENGVGPQATGPLSAESQSSSRRKRSQVQDAARIRQRFKPPRKVNHGIGSPLGGVQRPIDVDNLEQSSSTGVENELEAIERAMQIEEDEMLAMFLQQEYRAEAGEGSLAMDDWQLAQMLQDEENASSLHQRAESTSQATNASISRAARREVHRAPAARPIASSSRMRILRNLHNRTSQHVTRGRRLGGRTISANEHLLHFPEGLGLEARVEFLAALETASQADFAMLDQVDGDFNEADYEMLLALDDTDHAHSGASFDRIEQLPVSVIKPTDIVEEACSICLETPVVDDLVRRLPCMHAFHVQCIDVWFERKANCPICKMEL